MKAKDMNFVLLLDFYGGMLTERQSEVMEFYYDEDMSLAEIAQHALITRQGVRDIIKRAEAVLLEMEAKLGFAARFDGICKDVRRIKECAAQIRTACEHRGMENTVKKPVEEICALADRMLE